MSVKLSRKANKLVLKFQDNGYSVSKNNKPGGGGKGGVPSKYYLGLLRPDLCTSSGTASC